MKEGEVRYFATGWPQGWAPEVRMVVAEREGVGEMSPLIKINGEEVPLEQPLAPVGVPVEFEVVTAEMKESQKSGKPMLEV